MMHRLSKGLLEKRLEIGTTVIKGVVKIRKEVLMRRQLTDLLASNKKELLDFIPTCLCSIYVFRTGNDS